VGPDRRAAATLAGALAATGAGGIAAQTLLLREIIGTLGGSELTLGIALGSWLAAEALGALLARFGNGDGARARFAAASALFSALLPASLAAARVALPAAGIGPGQAAGITAAAAISAVAALATAFPHGYLLATGSIIAASPGAAGRVYGFAAAGSAAGGALLTYLLLPRADAFTVALAVAPLTLAASAVLLAWQPVPGVRSRGAASALAAAALASALALPLGAGRLLDTVTAARLRPGFEILARRDSPYAALTVARRQGQVDFAVDGRPAVTLPVPDLEEVESFAHLALAHHPAPRSVLVLEGGPGGLLAQILRHPVERVDCVIRDAVFLELLDRYSPPTARNEWHDPRVRMVTGDSRTFLAGTDARYDVILIGPRDPEDLATNLLFTVELFTLARARLAEGGVLAARASGSLAFLGPALRDLDAALYASLHAAFPHVRVVPGDTNLFLASSTDLTAIPARTLALRMAPAGRMAALTPEEVAYRLDPERVRRLEAAMAGSPRAGTVNTDARPIGVFLGIGYRNAALSPVFQRVFAALASVSLLPLLLAAPAALALLAAARRVGPAVLFSAGVTGFGGMLLELAIICLFQLRLGTLYQRVGVIAAAFMAGNAAGAALCSRAVRDGASGRVRRLLVAVDAGAAALSALIALTAPFLAHARSLPAPAAETAFLVASLAAGSIVGAEYPLALAMRAATIPLANAVGWVNAADLLGGVVAGVLGGAALLPVLGPAGCCYLIAAWEAAATAAVAVAGSFRKTRPPAPSRAA
jgi:predicted membrane-bound spermidine synthase